jgi:hypothetical protein
MNSFTLFAVGQLARSPGLSQKGPVTFARFCIVGSDSEIIDNKVKERFISMWFVAFGEVGDALVKNARKGDQLFLEATAIQDDWNGLPMEGMGNLVYEVICWRFGARRPPPEEVTES